jgi:hypothetical protein
MLHLLYFQNQIRPHVPSELQTNNPTKFILQAFRNCFEKAKHARLLSYGMSSRVALVRTYVSEERIVFIIRVTRISAVGTSLLVTSNRSKSRRNTMWCHMLFLRRVLQLLVTAKVIPSSPSLVTLIMDAIRSYETQFLIRRTRRHISEHGILLTTNTYHSWSQFITNLTNTRRVTNVDTCMCIRPRNPFWFYA